MNTLQHTRAASSMTLAARTASDLMTPNPVSIDSDATLRETARFLAARRIGAAPVIDEAGRPVGVVSRTDLLIREARRRGHLWEGTGCDHVPVRDIMSPVVFSVQSETPAPKVVQKLLRLGVRRLFVIDGDGVLIGVVSATDVLHNLRHREDNGAGADRHPDSSRWLNQGRATDGSQEEVAS